MEINIESLNTELERLTVLQDKFLDNYLNLYNLLSNASSYWQDPKATKFFDNVNMEKLKVKTAYDELASLTDTYRYVVESYQDLGTKITVNLNMQDKLIAKFNTIINNLNDIITNYNTLDLSFCPYEARMLLKEKNELIKIKNNIANLKIRVGDIFRQIEETEKEVKYRLSNINIELIKE